MSNDPLLQPYTLKHLTLKNRLMITSHEPAYAEDGMPKERYRAYHVERAKAGIAMTMTAGSAAISKDSPPAFNNVLAYKDEVVGWLKALADECHDHGCAVMIQLTHLGRRTRWDAGDWLPSVAPTHSAPRITWCTTARKSWARSWTSRFGPMTKKAPPSPPKRSSTSSSASTS